MDGIGIPIFGLIVGIVARWVCMGDPPRWQRFALAALVSPFVTSVVLYVFLGSLADSATDLALGLIFIGGAFLMSASMSIKLQGILAGTKSSGGSIKEHI